VSQKFAMHVTEVYVEVGAQPVEIDDIGALQVCFFVFKNLFI
jgi:hypothetical protein